MCNSCDNNLKTTTHATQCAPPQDFKYHSGNAERDGFGHIAYAVTDVYEASARLEAAGVPFKKKPDEGTILLPYVRSNGTLTGVPFKKKSDEGTISS